jgi:DNA-binding NtrC family response regulator
MTQTMVVVGEQDELITLQELERRYLLRVLKHCRGNRTRAARILGISRRAIYDKMDRLGLREVQWSADSLAEPSVVQISVS